MGKSVKFIILAILLVTGYTALAEEVPCRMRIDREKVSPGKQAQLEIELPKSYGVIVPEMPIIKDIDIRFSRSYPKAAEGITSDSQMMVFQYKVVPRTTGVFPIGPFRFQSGSDFYSTNQIMFVVEKEALRITPQQAPKSTDLKDHMYVLIDVPKTTVFINERVPVVLKLYTDWIDLENVSFSQKQSEYLLVKEFKDKLVEVIDKDATRFAVLKYTASFYAVTAGMYTLEPVSVKFTIVMPREGADGSAPELLNQNSPFYESLIGAAYSRQMELESEQVNITVMPLPVEDKPKSFRGAVGKFNFELKADKNSIKPMETVILTATISGEGNFDAMSAPVFGDPTGLKPSEPKINRSRDSISYDMPLTVQSKDIRSMPDLLFTYFDPSEKHYVTITRQIPVKLENIALSVKALSEDGLKANKAPEIRILPMKTTIDGPYPRQDPPYKGVSFWFFLIIPWVLIPSFIMFDRRRRYLDNHPSYAAFLRASRTADRSIRSAERSLKDGDMNGFYLKVFKIMQEYIGERVLISSAGVTGQTVDECVEPYVGKEMSSRIKQIFSECYSARYSAAGKDPAAMSLMLRNVGDVISEMNNKEFAKDNI
ncbi:MAG: BatD family protein [Candidatus Omnitrophica bacterium]|nr:BatD family protein [Candidatus Omnitrophota bacterium]